MRVLLASLILASSCLASDAPEDELVDEPITTVPALTLARTFVTNGFLEAAATDGRILYVGGHFDYIGQRSGEYALVSASTGVRDKSVPELAGGPVWAILPDGSGGYFFGGDMRSGGTIHTRGLLHLRADGTWDPMWHISAVGAIYALAKDATRLYVGGSFASINGQPRRNFAAFELATGALVAGTPDVAGGQIDALAVAGTRLFIGGEFGTVAGVSRVRLARLDLPALTVSAWNPGGADDAVDVLLPWGSGLYVGGSFTHVGGLARGHVASIDQSTAVVRPYNPNTDSTVFALSRLGSVLYLGGQFATVGGAPRSLVAAVDASTGALLPWTASVQGAWVRAIVATSTAVHIGGYFDSVGGQPRQWAAALDPTSGALLPWNPHPNDPVFALATHPSGILLGGRFSSVNGSTRTNLAAIDLSTGRATSFAPRTDTDPASLVWALHLSGSTLYVGGTFTTLAGQPRLNMGAVSTAGAPLAFRADADARVHVISQIGSTIYFGGEFTQVAGAPRSSVAAVDATTGALRSWAPAFGPGTALAMAPVGPSIYVGGGGARLALYDATTGAARPAPAMSGIVDELAYDGTNVYVSGQFESIAGVTRHGLAAFAPGSTTVTSWNPPLPEFREFMSLAVSGSYVYVDDFGKIYTVDKTSAAITTFSPRLLGGGTDQMIALPDRLLMIGAFHDIDNAAQQDIGEFMGTP